MISFRLRLLLSILLLDSSSSFSTNFFISSLYVILSSKNSLVISYLDIAMLYIRNCSMSSVNDLQNLPK